MKGILEFNLPEEREIFEDHVHAAEFRAAIHEYAAWLRAKLKYDDLPEGVITGLSMAMSRLIEELADVPSDDIPLYAVDIPAEKPVVEVGEDLNKPDYEMHLCRNETRGLRIETGENGTLPDLPGMTIKPYTIGTINIDKQLFDGALHGDVEDPLYEVGGDTLTKGTYLLDISCNSVGNHTLKVGDKTVYIKVYDITLPDKPVMPLNAELNAGSAMRAHLGPDAKGSSEEIMTYGRMYANTLIAHHIYPYRHYTHANSLKNYDYVRETSPGMLMIPGYYDKIDPEIIQWAKTIPEKTWFYLIDEPQESQVAKALIAEKTISGMVGDIERDDVALTMATCPDNKIPCDFNVLPMRPGNEGKGEGYYVGMWSHTGGVQYGVPGLTPVHPSVHRTAFIYLNYMLEATFPLYYHTNYAMRSAKSGTRYRLDGFNGYLDGTLFGDPKYGNPVPTLRMKEIRDAINDCSLFSVTKTTLALNWSFTEWPKDPNVYSIMRKDILNEA